MKPEDLKIGNNYIRYGNRGGYRIVKVEDIVNETMVRCKHLEQVDEYGNNCAVVEKYINIYVGLFIKSYGPVILKEDIKQLMNKLEL